MDTIVYAYGDAAWGDLLTAYDGVMITYDQMGNPISDGTWTYTWEHGRQLAAMSDGTTTWAYTYDANGMRTSRSNGTDTYMYVYNGGQLVQMTVGTHTLYFTYDAGGTPATVTLDGTMYYYITNLQGDVVAIWDETSNYICDYYYDAWGKVISRSYSPNHLIDDLNPLLYRGYVYDHDTGLYYLQSRYYNPTIGRFLSADVYASTGQGVLGNNMFAYCRNDPINRIDSSGTYDLDYFDLDGNPTTDEKDLWGRCSSGKGANLGAGNGPSTTYLGGKMYPKSPGRLGGTLHRAMVDSLRYMFQAFGFYVSSNEKRVYIEGDKYRYPDLIIKEGNQTVAYVQVGKTTQSGDPVARERSAKADLEKKDLPVLFYAYDD